MELKEAVTEFFYSRDIAPTTRDWYGHKLGAFVSWCKTQGVANVDEVTTKLVRQFIAHRKETPTVRHSERSSHTTHGDAREVRALVNFCIDEDFLAPGVFRKGMMPKRDEKIVPVFTPTEIDALLRACVDKANPVLSARDKAIVTVLLDTGIRANELCTLTLGRTNFSLTDAHIIVLGKGRKQREVGLGNKSRLALHRYIYQFRPRVESEAVFLTRHSTPLHPDGLAQMLIKLRNRSSLSFHIHPHKFRHTFAYMYMREGAGDVLRLSRLLGHSSVLVTENYLKVFDSRDARDSASVLDTLTMRRR